MIFFSSEFAAPCSCSFCNKEMWFSDSTIASVSSEVTKGSRCGKLKRKFLVIDQSALGGVGALEPTAFQCLGKAAPGRGPQEGGLRWSVQSFTEELSMKTLEECSPRAKCCLCLFC